MISGPSPISSAPHPDEILAALGQAAFVWDIATDAIVWTDQAAAIFKDVPAAALGKSVV